MTRPAMLLRVRSRRTPYRRGGIEFGSLPIVLGPEHFEAGLAGLRAIVAILTDPVLTVKRSAIEGEEGDFVTVEQAMIDEMVDALAVIEQAESLDGDRDAIAAKIEELIGKSELQSPEDAEDEEDDAAASESDAGAKADGGTDAAPAVDNPPASDAAAASGEQSRAGADASGAAPAADADAGYQPGDAQQPPVAATDTAKPAEAKPVPAKAKAKTVAKPASSSGRKRKAATLPAAKG